MHELLAAFLVVHFWTYFVFANYPDHTWGMFVLEYTCASDS
jgi:hypothetical protein